MPFRRSFVGEAAVAAAGGGGLVAGAVAGWYRRGGFVTLSGLLFTLALLLLDLPAARPAGQVSSGARGRWRITWRSRSGWRLSAAFWSAVRFTDPRAGRRRTGWPCRTRPAPWWRLALFLFVVPVAITSRTLATASPFGELGVIGWATAALGDRTGTAVAVWGGRTDYGLPCLYLLGLGTLGLAIGSLLPTGRQLVWIGPLAHWQRR
ncbi:MAG: hypothetical protein U0736_20455 [Gemmataceae bacterium]